MRAGWTPRPGGGPGPLRRGSTKALQRNGRRKARKGLQASSRSNPVSDLRTVTPRGSDDQGPRFRAGGASCQRAGPGQCRERPFQRGGKQAGCGACLCFSVSLAGRIGRVSEACGSASRTARAGAPAEGKASRTHQVQSPGTHRARQGAHGELRRHAPLLPKAEKGPKRWGKRDPPELSSPNQSPKKEGRVQ